MFSLYLKEIRCTIITIEGNTCEYLYVVYGKRIDIDKMDTETDN